MTIHIHHCLRCGHEWPSKLEKPLRCANPRCKSPYWDRPRRNEAQGRQKESDQ